MECTHGYDNIRLTKAILVRKLDEHLEYGDCVCQILRISFIIFKKLRSIIIYQLPSQRFTGARPHSVPPKLLWSMAFHW
jgi:hypothetical protein